MFVWNPWVYWPITWQLLSKFVFDLPDGRNAALLVVPLLKELLGYSCPMRTLLI